MTTPRSTPRAAPKPTRRLTTAQALVAFLARQYTERDGRRHRLIDATWGIFGHGNVAGIGQALVEAGAGDAVSSRAATSRPWCTPPSATPASRAGSPPTPSPPPSAPAPPTSSPAPRSPPSTTCPSCCCPATPSRPAPPTPCSSSSKCPTRATCRSTTACGPVSRYFDRITRPEALIPAALQAMRILADPAETGAVTLALPQDVQAEAYDWPEEFFADARLDTYAGRPPTRANSTEAVRAVRAARRPLIVAGGGVHHSARRGRPRRVRRRHRHPGRLHPGGQGLPAPRPPRRRGRHRPHRHRHGRRTGPRGRPGDRDRHPLHRLHHRLRHPLRRPGRPLPQPQHHPLRRPQARRPPAGRGRPHRARSARPRRLSACGHRVDRRRTRASTPTAKGRWEQRVDAAFAAARPGRARPTQAQVLGAAGRAGRRGATS